MIQRKPIFDAVARMVPGIWNKPGTIPLMDAAIDEAEGVIVVTAPRPGRAVGPKGLDLIRRWEGCKLKAYPDPGTGGAPWTIGWGSTTDEWGKPIKPGTIWTQERADKRFLARVAEFAADVESLLDGVPTSQEQFDALVSFAYNVGSDIDSDDDAEGLGDSTLLKKHLRGDFEGAAAEFAGWKYANGKVLQGLINRRAEEAALYRAGS